MASMRNTTSHDHEYTNLEYQEGPFDVVVRQSTSPEKIDLQFRRGERVLVHMELNRTAALEIAGLILDEVRYLDHRADVAAIDRRRRVSV